MSFMQYYGQFSPPVDQFLFERYFSYDKSKGVFVECGAFDGQTESSCKFFEETLGWSGFNLEPVPWIYKELCNNRPNSVNLNLGLSNKTEKRTFYAVDHPTYGLNCTNGSLQHTEMHRQLLEKAGCSFKNVEVDLVTWPKFVTDYAIQHVDLFVLDVEGHELSVIESMKDTIVLPNIMCVEYGHVDITTLHRQLSSMGYSHDVSLHANAYYIRTDLINLFAFRKQNEILAVTKTLEADINLLEERNKSLVESIDFIKAKLNEVTKTSTQPLKYIIFEIKHIAKRTAHVMNIRIIAQKIIQLLRRPR